MWKLWVPVGFLQQSGVSVMLTLMRTVSDAGLQAHRGQALSIHHVLLHPRSLDQSCYAKGLCYYNRNCNFLQNLVGEKWRDVTTRCHNEPSQSLVKLKAFSVFSPIFYHAPVEHMLVLGSLFR